jgi:hypothetical protein
MLDLFNLACLLSAHVMVTAAGKIPYHTELSQMK